MPTTSSTLLGFDWREKHVQPAINNANSFITSETHVLGFGPPLLSNVVTPSGGPVIPNAFDIPVVLAGVVESYSVAQGQQVIKVYEIGSVRSYLIASRADGQVSLNRVLLNNQSLLRMMYAAYRSSSGSFEALIGASSPGIQTIDVGSSQPGTINDGSNDFFFAMQSPLFKNAFGAMIFMKDAQNKVYSAAYFENCLVASHGFAASSSGVIVQEAASFRYDRILPVNVRSVTIG